MSLYTMVDLLDNYSNVIRSNIKTLEMRMSDVLNNLTSDVEETRIQQAQYNRLERELELAHDALAKITTVTNPA